MSARRHRWCVFAGLLLTAALAASCDVELGDVLVPTSRDAAPPPDAAPPTKVSRVDLLLMIDNSTSMADKQDILALTVPDLVQRLVDRDEKAVSDLHIGVITSSLGGAGADMCSDLAPGGGHNPRMQDMAHLIARSPTSPSQPLPTWRDKGFLFWDPSQQGNPPGEASSFTLIDRFASMVRGAGQDGCGFEMSLEAWYRFLVDPAPYEKIVPTDCETGEPTDGGGCRGPYGIDQSVIVQRADFLRPDSLVVVLMLTDEDDCSVRAEGQGFLALQAYFGMSPFHLPRATSACATDPASKLCTSCGIPGQEGDPECQKGLYTDTEDALNLRCWDQKRRFGIDFLHPVDRYVGALTRPRLEDGAWNPLFCPQPSPDGMACLDAPRDPSQILLAGIVGVPWQLIARDTNDLSKGYLPSTELAWDAIAGDPTKFVDPSSPFMKPSVEPRSGTDPITGESVAAPTASGPEASRINGHEWSIPGRNDLQYACVFRLPVARECAGSPVSCDCAEEASDNPLCQAPDGTYGTKQYRAKAYPSPRILSVMRGLGSRSVVTSVCAAQVEDTSSPVFGYRPAVDAIVSAMLPSL